MGVEVCLEGCVDLRRREGEEGSARDGACVVDEDCAGAKLEERVLVMVELDVGGYFCGILCVRLSLLIAWLFVRPRCWRRRTCRSGHSPALRSALLAHGYPRRRH